MTSPNPSAAGRVVLAGLPLELIRLILKEALLVRGWKRALRLRLVNKLFAAEAFPILASMPKLELDTYYRRRSGPMLKTRETFEATRRRTNPELAASFLSQYLLSEEKTLSPKLDHIRKLARRLALDDVDGSTTYPTYVRGLSTMIVLAHHRRFRIYEWFWHPLNWYKGKHELMAIEDNYEDPRFRRDLLVAAIWTEKHELIRELCQDQDIMQLAFQRGGVMNNVFKIAAMRENFTVLAYLLENMDVSLGDVNHLMRSKIFPNVYRFGSATAVERLLGPEWQHVWDLKRSNSKFLKSCVTPHVENMKVVERFIKGTSDADWNERELGTLLHTAACHGWDDMAGHLLAKCAGLGLRLQLRMPLVMACRNGNEGVVRHLLQHGANLTGEETGEAARKGFLGIVKMLVAHGADVHSTTYVPEHAERGPSPMVVGALMAEHTEMVRWLVEYDGTLKDELKTAKGTAKKEGLESMAALLEEMK